VAEGVAVGASVRVCLTGRLIAMSAAPRPEGPLAASIERLRGELDRWVETAWNQGERAMETIGIRGRNWTPPIDVVESPESVQVLIDLPGVAPEGIDLTLAGHMLTVSGVVPALDLGSGGEQHVGERPHGEFKRSIPLPASVAPETISAAHAHGVLTVTIRKTEQERARKIPVQASAPPV